MKNTVREALTHAPNYPVEAGWAIVKRVRQHVSEEARSDGSGGRSPAWLMLYLTGEKLAAELCRSFGYYYFAELAVEVAEDAKEEGAYFRPYSSVAEYMGGPS